MWQAIAGIFRSTLGTQTVDTPNFALGHYMNGDPILLADIVPKGKSPDDITEEEKEAYVAPYRRPVTRGGLSAYKGAGIHLNSQIASQPYKVRLILIPFFLKFTRYMFDGIWGDWNKAAYRFSF